MAGPLPPPPPPPPPMGAPALDLPLGPPAKMPAGRDALLGDIQKGMRLKKTVTVDKSKPLLDAKPSAVSAPSLSVSLASPLAPTLPAGPQLGDIFAGGMPKLKSVRDNRAGIVPPSAPRIPVPGVAPQLTPPAPLAPLAPTTRPPPKRTVPPVARTSDPQVSGTAPPPPPPPLPSAGPPPLPPTSPTLAPASTLKVPRLPPSRPKKLSHLRSASYSSVNSFEDRALLPSAAPPPPPPPAPPAPPGPPPLPLAPPPVPSSLVDAGSSKQGLIAPPPPPAAPALPGGLPFLAEINSRRTDDGPGGSAPPPPTFNIKPSSATPPPPPPPLPSSSVPLAPPPPPGNLALPLGGSAPSKPALGGGLPFLAEINAKRNDAFVVDETSTYSTKQESSLTLNTAPPSKVIPLNPPPPRHHGLPPNSPAPPTPVVPPPPPAPPTLFSPHVPAAPPTPLGTGSYVDLDSDDLGFGSKRETPKAPPPPAQSAPQLPPSLPPSSHPPPSRPQPINKPKKAAPPPPPPSALDQQQSVGQSLRKISALTYTINTLHRKQASEAKNIIIEDSRFKFINSNALPNPRRFEGKEKLYPSGRGSSLPLDLSSL